MLWRELQRQWHAAELRPSSLVWRPIAAHDEQWRRVDENHPMVAGLLPLLASDPRPAPPWLRVQLRVSEAPDPHFTPTLAGR